VLISCASSQGKSPRTWPLAVCCRALESMLAGIRVSPASRSVHEQKSGRLKMERRLLCWETICTVCAREISMLCAKGCLRNGTRNCVLISYWWAFRSRIRAATCSKIVNRSDDLVTGSRDFSCFFLDSVLARYSIRGHQAIKTV
jgi:hypothetical protein